jgi:hypothetical protein
MQHPYTLAHFEKENKEVVDFVRALRAQIDAGKRHILVKAPVKSGKRIMVEVIAVLLGVPVRYITSLNRKDVKSQQAELESYGVVTHVMDRKEKVAPAISDIRVHTRSGRVVCCFDECDYGSGSKQVVSPLFAEFLDTATVVKVYFSATAHETAVSALTARPDYVAMTYVPPATYRGAAFFLQSGLVFDPQPFFDLDDGTLSITAHARQVLCDSITDDRHIGIVRVAERGVPMSLFKDEDKRKVLEAQLATTTPGREWTIKPIDEQTPFDWENARTRAGYVNHPEMGNVLFVVKQTCGRGTDLKGWHPKLAFWHDARAAPKANLNTTIQAFLRPSHYSPRPGQEEKMPGYSLEGERIRLYVDVRVVQVAVDDDMDTYLKAGGKAPARTRVRKIANYALSERTFASVEEARVYSNEHYYGSTSERRLDETGHYPYRGGRRAIKNEMETRQMELGEGVKDAARIIPFRNGAGGVSYLVAYSLGDDSSSVSSVKSLETTNKSMYQ